MTSVGAPAMILNATSEQKARRRFVLCLFTLRGTLRLRSLNQIVARAFAEVQWALGGPCDEAQNSQLGKLEEWRLVCVGTLELRRLLVASREWQPRIMCKQTRRTEHKRDASSVSRPVSCKVSRVGARGREEESGCGERNQW